MAAWTRGNYTLELHQPDRLHGHRHAGGTVVQHGTYTSGTPISFNGINVTLTARRRPATASPSMTMPAARGDNSNCAAMAATARPER